MYPDAVLANIRENVQRFIAAAESGDDSVGYDEALCAVAGSFGDLDEWLSGGGSLPAAWVRK